MIQHIFSKTFPKQRIPVGSQNFQGNLFFVIYFFKLLVFIGVAPLSFLFGIESTFLLHLMVVIFQDLTSLTLRVIPLDQLGVGLVN